MSDAAPAEVQGAVEGRDSVAGDARAYLEKLKAGDVGSLPVILGIVLITFFFTAKVNVFFTAVNFPTN